MKLKKILLLILTFSLCLGAASCNVDSENESETPNAGAYEKMLDAARKNGDTDKYTFVEGTQTDITSMNISGLTGVFVLRDSSYNTVYVYNFSNSVDATAYMDKMKSQNYMGVDVVLVDNAVILGHSSMVAFVKSCEVYEEPPKLDWCVYKDSRDVSGRETVTIKMTVRDYGEVTILLDATTAPVTVANFKKLVSEGFYDGLTFHRVIKNFMIQGGDPEANGTGGSDEEIFGEFSSNGHENDILHLRGVISMARSGKPNSASSQFFICNADAPHLDGSYAAFGYVISGMNVIDAITKDTAKYGDSNGGIANKALQAVIEKIEITE